MPTLAVDDAQLFYERHGSGDPLLLIHGAGRSGRSFDDLVPLLADRYTVIVPDLRGLGRSSRAESVHPRQWVADVVAILDEEGVGQAVVVGVSLGSRIAGRLALEHPDRVRGLVADAPMIGLSDEGNAHLTKEFATQSWPADQAAFWERMHGADWREVLSFYARVRSTAEFQEYLTLRPHLADLRVPTLITRGDTKETVHPLEDAVVWFRQAPDTRLWIEPNAVKSSLSGTLTEHFAERVTDFAGTRIGVA